MQRGVQAPRPAPAAPSVVALRRCAQRQADDRLRVARLGDQRVELGERADVDVDPLVLRHLRALADVGDAGREEEVDLLVGEAGRGVEPAERLPVGRLLADLLGELALGGRERVLPLLVELAGGDLQQVRETDGLARLADEPQLVAVEHHDPDGAGVRDDLALDLLAVLVAEARLHDAEEAALVDRLGGRALEAGAHGRAVWQGVSRAGQPPRRAARARRRASPRARRRRRARWARGCARCRWRG